MIQAHNTFSQSKEVGLTAPGRLPLRITPARADDREDMTQEQNPWQKAQPANGRTADLIMMGKSNNPGCPVWEHKKTR